MNRVALELQLKAHEGYRQYPYLDSLGYATVGWGHWIDKEPASKFVTVGALIKHYSSRNQHVAWFAEDIDKATAMAKEWLPGFATMTDTRQRVSVEMCFVLGSKVSQFRKFKIAVMDGDHHEAAAQMIDSLWHRQATNRVNALAEQWAEG